MNVRECPYVVETAQMCQTLIREVNAALTWADTKTAIDAINTVRRRSESMIAEWHHLHPDENAGSCKSNAPVSGAVSASAQVAGSPSFRSEVERIATDYIPDNDSQAPLALDEMREALHSLLANSPKSGACAPRRTP